MAEPTHKPYVSPDTDMKEFTVRALIIGLVCATGLSAITFRYASMASSYRFRLVAILAISMNDSGLSGWSAAACCA